MGLFASDANNCNGYTIIVGCGRLGADLAVALSDSGGNVIVIDKKEEAFRNLSPSFSGIAIAGDGTDIHILTQADIHKATAVIAVTNNDNTNIMVAQLAKELFSIEQVIARLFDSDREYVYNEFGIDTICPAVLSAKEIDKLLGVKEILGEAV